MGTRPQKRPVTRNGTTFEQTFHVSDGNDEGAGKRSESAADAAALAPEFPDFGDDDGGINLDDIDFSDPAPKEPVSAERIAELKTEAREAVVKLHGESMGGFSDSATSQVMDRWFTKLDKTFDNNALKIAVSEARGWLDSDAASIVGYEGKQYSQAGLHDTEGRHAIADYFKIRLGVNSRQLGEGDHRKFIDAIPSHGPVDQDLHGFNQAESAEFKQRCRDAVLASHSSMGGFSGKVTPEVLDRWMDHLDEAVDAHAVDMARQEADNHLDWNALDYEGLPYGEFSEAGLYDTEGRHAAADYYRYRLGLTKLPGSETAGS